jgi:hypothetical protein
VVSSTRTWFLRKLKQGRSYQDWKRYIQEYSEVLSQIYTLPVIEKDLESQIKKSMSFVRCVNYVKVESSTLHREKRRSSIRNTLYVQVPLIEYQAGAFYSHYNEAERGSIVMDSRMERVARFSVVSHEHG